MTFSGLTGTNSAAWDWLRCLAVGGTAPAVLNAANEVAVNSFLNHKITFDRIPTVIERALTLHKTRPNPEIQDILEADQQTVIL